MEHLPISEYPGKPLSLGNSFRLLELQPGQGTDPVIVQLVDASLDNAAEYEALSYTWGDQSLITKIQVAGTNSTHNPITASMAVTLNCFAALKRLRKVDSVRILWVDAICINQELVSERNHQLGLMRHIYACAWRVVIYLGEASDESDVMLDWLQQSDQASGYGQLDYNHPAPPTRAAIHAFLNRPWFHRVWILQEITFGKASVAVCGDRVLDWDVVKGLGTCRGFGGWSFDIPYAFQFPYKPEFTYNWQFASYGERLLAMLVNSRHCKATDPRDKLYAILPLLALSQERMLHQLLEQARDSRDKQVDGLNEDTLRSVIDTRPDYSLSPAQVFTELARHLIGSVGLGVLSNVVTPRLIPSLPSWVPDWSICKAPRRKGPIESSRADEFGWKLKARQNRVTASSAWRISEYTLPCGNQSSQLHLRSVNIGSIIKLGIVCNIAENFFPMHEWWDLVADTNNPQELLPEPPDGIEVELWGYGHDYHGLTSWFETLPECKRRLDFWRALGCFLNPRGCFLAFTMINRYSTEIRGGLNRKPMSPLYPMTTDEKTTLIDIFEELPNETWVVVAREVLLRCDGRSLFVTDTGQIGLVDGTVGVQIGDSVRVVEEASTPLIFRNHSFSMNANSNMVSAEMGSMSATNEKDDYVELLGDAYVKEFMHGEVWNQVNDGSSATLIDEILVR